MDDIDNRQQDDDKNADYKPRSGAPGTIITNINYNNIITFIIIIAIIIITIIIINTNILL